ncbi:hypothetical protein N4P33_12480 [Streptomyces sp. 15-116A]|nr:hypothetical protein [Streptomyces sp. 15-116A]MCT7352982.1 hypothetical protein [Streptomyces sp. 15-116A]
MQWYRNASRSLSESAGYTESESRQLFLPLIDLGAWPAAMPQLTRPAISV